jgi:hypothetical protein
LELNAEGRLSDVAGLGGPLKIQVLREGDEVLELS